MVIEVAGGSAVGDDDFDGSEAFVQGDDSTFKEITKT